MKNKITAYVCSGFNNNFDVPKIDGTRRAVYRSAVIIKKVDWLDTWSAYEDIVCRIIQKVQSCLSSEIEIDYPEVSHGFVKSLPELRNVERTLSALDSEYSSEPLTEIRFLICGRQTCLMTLEDWSDIGKPEPYAISYTYSFYSYDATVDKQIRESIRAQLFAETAVGDVKEHQECAVPKWYWPLMDIFRSEKYFICGTLSVLGCVAVISIMGFPNASTAKRKVQDCGYKEMPLTWCEDFTPITKRIPALSSCTNMLWHGEIITKNSLLSVPGPSAYRVCCFIPNASKSILDLSAVEYSQEVIHDGIDFLPAEKAMLKSEFKIDPDSDAGIFNEQLTHKLLQSPYWGQSIYFKTNDVLCIVLFGE